ncbi:MAG: VWA domain-containing protein [Desulfobacteraceae bacterium]|nr:VWA domain-containing protein [Desulfobacteraceae bacterium]
MVNVILKFISCCRAADMRISTAEVLDCLNQLEVVDFCDESLFNTVLRANFAKSRREQGEFDRLYQLFFHEMQTGLQSDGGLPEKTLAGVPDELSDKLAQLVRQLRDQEGSRQIELEKEQGNKLDQALMDFLAGNPLAFIQEVQKIHNQDEKASLLFKSNLGQLSSRLEIMLGVNRLKNKMVQFLGSNDSLVDADVSGLEEAMNRQLNKALDFLNTEVRLDNAGLKETRTHELHYKTLGEIPFSNLSCGETQMVKQIIDRLVRKLEEITTRRFSAASRGMVDVKKTIQRSVKYLGVPLEIVHKSRSPRRGKIVTLCDVSGSVWSAARFMLNILYSLQTCFSRVKSYVFIETPLDVSSFFKFNEPNKAIKQILNDPRINYNTRTDYGMAFQQFRDNHLQELDKKTTLIIIGDARSNYLNPREPLLESMRERCKRLIWLNPEQEKFWGTGDSEMKKYRSHCNEARACGNLNQLIDFIEALVL